jgi:hypothetical protein
LESCDGNHDEGRGGIGPPDRLPARAHWQLSPAQSGLPLQGALACHNTARLAPERPPAGSTHRRREREAQRAG